HHKTRPEYVLAIECDGATYHSSESARDRDRLRQEQLERLGWRFYRIWSSDWYYNKEKAVARVLEAYERAVKAADGEARADARTGRAAAARASTARSAPQLHRRLHAERARGARQVDRERRHR